MSVMDDVNTVMGDTQRELNEWWLTLDAGTQQMVIWCSSGLVLRMFAHFVPQYSAATMRTIPCIGECIAQSWKPPQTALTLIFNATTFTLFVLCIPRNGVQFMCTEYKTKKVWERQLYKVCLWSQAFCKPTNAWPFDLICFVLQGFLIAENEREIKEQNNWPLHTVVACGIVIFSTREAAWRLTELIRRPWDFCAYCFNFMVSVATLYAAATLYGDETQFTVFQRVFILSGIALKLLEGYGPLCEGRVCDEDKQGIRHALVPTMDP